MNTHTLDNQLNLFIYLNGFPLKMFYIHLYLQLVWPPLLLENQNRIFLNRGTSKSRYFPHWDDFFYDF